MQNTLKNRIERSLKKHIGRLNRAYALNRVSPLLSRSIEEFVLRKGKRLRPVLFITGYLGFARKTAANLYQSALSIELLHAFLLVHDDIIDKADTRRGKPSMHRLFNNYLSRFKNLKFNGQDLSIVAGDIIFAMAIDSFLSIRENPRRKERALKNFLQAAVLTPMGEFIELLSGTTDIRRITKEDIYKIYDYKTAHYTFACPLSTGAILAGAGKKEVDRLYKYGIYLGRAFQIQDDILGIFGEKKQTGKSPLTDLQEAKRTLPVWSAYHRANSKDKLTIRRILLKDTVRRPSLLLLRKIIKSSGALDDMRKEISGLIQKSRTVITPSRMSKRYKLFLDNYSQQLLSLQ